VGSPGNLKWRSTRCYQSDLGWISGREPVARPGSGRARAIAQAENADDAAQVLESFAAPVGSYRTKRRGERAYIFLNGCLGVGGSREKVNGTTSGVLGVAAPVGIEIGVPVDGWSVGLLAQVLDLGTLASYRLSDGGNVEQEPEVGFAQVFSPGAYFLVGVRDFPLTLGVGFNVAPRLRTINEGNPNTESTENALRLPMFFFAVDIPIFGLN